MANFLGLMNKTFPGKILGITLGITVMGTIGYDHAVANWNILTLAKLIDPDSVSWTGYIVCVLLSTFGNAVGGFCFMSCPAALTIYLEKTHYKNGIPQPLAKTKDEEEVELEDLGPEPPRRTKAISSHRRAIVAVPESSSESESVTPPDDQEERIVVTQYSSSSSSSSSTKEGGDSDRP
jgi:hypothetical protein